jgi:hypothetical protein
MTNQKKLSLLSVILININIMLGAGVFINTVVLAKTTGSLSPLSYVIVGFLLLPIVLSIVKLWESCKSQATFYQLGSHISPFVGFLSSWCYFIGKISTFSLGIHVCSSILQQLFIFFDNIPVLLLDLIFIFIYSHKFMIFIFMCIVTLIYTIIQIVIEVINLLYDTLLCSILFIKRSSKQ